MEAIAEINAGHSQRSSPKSMSTTLENIGDSVIEHHNRELILGRYLLRKSASNFLDRPIAEVPSTQAYVDDATQSAEQYELIEHSIVVETANGTPLLYFLKGGMTHGRQESERCSIEKSSRERIEDFIKVYEPRMPHKDDHRHQIALKKEKAR